MSTELENISIPDNTYWRKRLYKFSTKYHSTFNTMYDDYKFLLELLEKDYKSAMFFLEFCEEVYTNNPKTKWGKERRNSWVKDLFAASPYNLLQGEEK